MVRVPIPSVDRGSFREAVANALVHRDYTRLGAVHIRWEREALSISNPGGFVEGVTLDNLLSVEPKPRNPMLADAFKRIGLVERTGRGVDIIYEGLLRYGRPAPDYSRSDSTTVVVRLSLASADIPFLQMIIHEQERTNSRVPLDALIVLAKLRDERRLDTAQIARAIQKDEGVARSVVERLVEAGLVEAHGVKKGRTYTLSAGVYKGIGKGVDYVRQAGYEAIQQEQMVRSYVRAHGEIRRRDVVELCNISPDQAYRLLRKLADEGLLTMSGQKKTAVYHPGPKL